VFHATRDRAGLYILSKKWDFLYFRVNHFLTKLALDIFKGQRARGRVHSAEAVGYE